MDTQARDIRHIKMFLGCLVMVVVILILKELKAIFLPLFLALLFYFLFNGAVTRMTARRVPKSVALTLLLIFLLVLFYFTGVLVYTGVASFVGKFPEYSSSLSNLLNRLFEQFRIPIADVNEFIRNFDWSRSVNTITGLLSTTFGSFAVFLGNLFMVIFFLMFMLAGRNALINRIRKAFAPEKSVKTLSMIDAIENNVQHYLLLKTMISLLTAVVGGVVLLAGGSDFILFFSLLIFFLNFIPNIGSIAATALPILLGVIKFGFSLRVLLMGLGLILTQMIIGNVVEPKVTGENLNLSPIVILISLILWGWMWGVAGMILAVPLTSAIKIIMEQSQELRPYSELISAE